MEDNHSLYKGKGVMMWLRFGYTFSKKARVGYDFVRIDGGLVLYALFATLIHLFQRIHVVQVGRILDLYYRPLTQRTIHLLLNYKGHYFLTRG